MERKCPKCSHEMEIGFLLSGGHMFGPRQTWIAGTPELNWAGGLKYEHKPWAPTETWLCKSCGYLESYALLQKDTG